MMKFWRNMPISLRWALGISVAIHLIVIFPLAFKLYSPISMPQAPFNAVLLGAGDTAHAGLSPHQTAPVSLGESKKLVTDVKTKPQLKVNAAESVRDVAATAHSATVGVAQGDATVAPNAMAKNGIVGGAPEAARDGAEADALQRYRLALSAEARKVRRYPEVSRARGIEGVCEVIVVLSKSGGVPTVVAGRSSGSQILDEAALAMGRLAVERTPVPTELQGRNLRIPLRFRFTLDDF